MRHGKAEKQSGRRADAERRLVQKGRERTRAAALAFSRYLAGAGRIQVWSSPLARAKQSAEIVAEVLGVAVVEECQEIADGDLKVLLSRTKSAAEDDAIVVVGHQPFLTEWAEALAGIHIPFKPSAAAGMELKFGKGAARLRWYVHPKAALDFSLADKKYSSSGEGADAAGLSAGRPGDADAGEPPAARRFSAFDDSDGDKDNY